MYSQPKAMNSTMQPGFDPWDSSEARNQARNPKQFRSRTFRTYITRIGMYQSSDRISAITASFRFSRVSGRCSPTHDRTGLSYLVAYIGMRNADISTLRYFCSPTSSDRTNFQACSTISVVRHAELGATNVTNGDQWRRWSVMTTTIMGPTTNGQFTAKNSLFKL